MENRSLVTIAEHSKEKILYLLEMAKEFEKKPNRKFGWQSSRHSFLRTLHPYTTQF